MIKIKGLKANKERRRKKTKLINKVYKSTFNSINNVVFIAIICFDTAILYFITFIFYCCSY